MKKLTNQDYRLTLQKEKAAVVEFTSPTCGHCKAMQAVLQKIEDNDKTATSFYQIDITQAEDAVAEYNIMSVPTFLFIRNGEIQDKLIGEIHQAILEQSINRLQ